jgi:hypothetical protein
MSKLLERLLLLQFLLELQKSKLLSLLVVAAVEQEMLETAVVAAVVVELQ